MTQDQHNIDALLPHDMALKAEAVGVAKAKRDVASTFVLAVLAGAFISLGAVFATTVAAGAGEALPYGVAKLLIGLVFSLGLILVIVGGAELFTGNNLIAMAWVNKQVSGAQLVQNWVVVYVGNLVGALGTVGLVFLSGQYGFGSGAVGVAALSIAKAKVALDFVPALCLGILCNALVCLAVWLCFSARTTGDKILAIVPPITAFVACGFEHSIANMYFLPIAMLIKESGGDAFWVDTGLSPEQFEGLSWNACVTANLIPVTIGNIIGGSVLVGVVYWFVYLRTRRDV